jgi:hypothetical protein
LPFGEKQLENAYRLHFTAIKVGAWPRSEASFERMGPWLDAPHILGIRDAHCLHDFTYKFLLPNL